MAFHATGGLLVRPVATLAGSHIGWVSSTRRKPIAGYLDRPMGDAKCTHPQRLIAPTAMPTQSQAHGRRQRLLTKTRDAARTRSAIGPMRESFRELPPTVQLFSVILNAVALAMMAVTLPSIHLAVAASLVLVFAATGLVKPIPYTDPSGGNRFPTSSVKIVTALLWAPQDVLIGVGLGSFLGLILFRRSELWRAANNGSGWGLAVASAALTAHLTAATISPGILQLTVAGVVAMATNRIVNEGIFSIYSSLRLGFPFASNWHQHVVQQWPYQLLATPIGIVLAAIAALIGNTWTSLALTAVSVVALPIPRQELAYYDRAGRAVAEVVEAVVRALEGVDARAREHGDRVSDLAGAVGHRLRMSEAGLRALRLAARLHDVGLLAGPDGPPPHDHASAGGRILARYPEPLIAAIVWGHHERWDGTGFPNHTRGRATPLGARILAATEVYDEVRFGAGNGGPGSQADAVAHLRALAGTALDPRVVEAVISVVEERDRIKVVAG